LRGAFVKKIFNNYVILGLAVLSIISIAFIYVAYKEEKKPIPVTYKPVEKEVKKLYPNEYFKNKFPLQYNSYMQTEFEVKTKHNGSVKETKFSKDKEPYLPILFNGYGFALDYNEDRGHVYAIEDVKGTMRVNDQTIGACLTCKSTAAPNLLESMGMSYYSANFKEDILPKAEELKHESIGCSDCHNPETMELQVTRSHFIEAMGNKGIDVKSATPVEMKNYVCGQCHVEYYFRSVAKKVTLPLRIGYTAAAGFGYYYAFSFMSEGDFINPISGTPILKAQHPDFETYMTGKHRERGANCVDCHMPKHTSVEGKIIRSHTMASPLRNLEGTCLTCHEDKSKAQVTNEILNVQERHLKKLHEAEEISVRTHYYINKMITSKADPTAISAAQSQVHYAQWYWDFVAAENSTGFHDPEGAIANLEKSILSSQKALDIATSALIAVNVDINELETQIKDRMNAVLNEPDSTKKKDHAFSDYFPSVVEKK
jgi:nitrite reductase (cytochrome c-552)